MIDWIRARRAHEAALRALTMYQHAMEDLGVQTDVAAQGDQDAPGEATGAAGTIVPPDAASLALAEPAQTGAAKNCATCGEPFRPHPQGAHRARYCPDHRTPAARRKAESRRQAAAVMAQAERDGYPSTLMWENGRATSTPKR